MSITTQCPICKYHKFSLTCKAFPKGIPSKILTGEFDHTKKHPDQKNNIVFEKGITNAK
jgi:hypothetical protein